MSFANQLKGGKAPAESFFGILKALHTDGQPMPFAVVQVQGTGEERRVALNPNSKINLKEGQERPEIKSFVSGKQKCEIGGTLRVETAYHDRATGLWLARWMNTALRNPDAGYTRDWSEVRVGALVKNPSTGSDYRPLDVLDSSRAVRVTTLAELEAAVSRAVADRNYGNAFVRYHGIDDEGGTAIRGVLLSGGKPDGASDEERVQRALSSEQNTAKELKSYLANGDAAPNDTFEVVPAMRLMFGADSAKNKRLDALFCTTSEDGARTYSKGFTAAAVTVHYRDDGSHMVVSAVPKSPDGEFNSVGANFKYEVASESAHDADLPDEMDLGAVMNDAPPAAARPRPTAPGF